MLSVCLQPEVLTGKPTPLVCPQVVQKMKLGTIVHTVTYQHTSPLHDIASLLQIILWCSYCNPHCS